LRGLPSRVRQLLNKAKEAANLAVDVYNRPNTSFRTSAYIVLMIIAWTSLFHAIFERRKTPYFFRKKGSRRFVKINGELKAWDLTTCLNEYYEDKNPPVRKNLEFFIELRNKIEHRFIPDLDPEVAGECQALLLNFENMLVATFGNRHALAGDLVFPLQFSQVRSAARATALRKLQATEFARIKAYVDKYRADLGAEVWKGTEFSFRVYLLPKLGNRPTSSDLAVEFVRYDESNPAEMEKYSRAVALIKEKQVPVANLGLLKASEVVRRVRESTGKHFTNYQHVQSWRFFHVRPTRGEPNPANCDSRYCFYDAAHGDYLYTDAWVEHLVRELATDARYGEVCPRKGG
jgi:hypothetical protein